MEAIEPLRHSLRVSAADGAEAALELLLPAHEPARQALFFLPALGVGVSPNLRFASAMAQQGIATAVLEWRGLGVRFEIVPVVSSAETREVVAPHLDRAP